MTPINIPETLKPGIGVLHGYTGGMALYVGTWDSVLMLYRNAPAKVVLTFERFLSIPLN